MIFSARFTYWAMRHHERRSRWLMGHAVRDEFSPHASHRASAAANEDESRRCDEMAAEYRKELGL